MSSLLRTLGFHKHFVQGLNDRACHITSKTRGEVWLGPFIVCDVLSVCHSRLFALLFKIIEKAKKLKLKTRIKTKILVKRETLMHLKHIYVTDPHVSLILSYQATKRFAASKTQTCTQQWSESVSAEIFSRTKEKLCCLACQTCAYNDFMVQMYFLWGALKWLCLTIADMCHVLCWHWDEEKGYGTERFIQGHCGAPGIHVVIFVPDIIHPSGLEAYTVKIAHVYIYIIICPLMWGLLFSMCFTV